MSARQLSYRTFGQPDRPAVLLLHGFLGSKDDWQEVATALASDHYLIAVDLPGHGESAEGFSEEDYSMAGCVELLANLLDVLNVRICTPIGYSMGGRMALYFAINNPDRCHALIIESASPGLRTEPERSDRRIHDNALAERLLNGPLDRFLSEWYSQPLFEPTRKAMHFDELLQRRHRNRPDGLALSLKQMGTGAQPSLWDRLADLRIPTLLLTGERDGKFTRIAQEMAALLPNCSVVTIEIAGHTLHFEAPDCYIAAVRRFLAERK